MERQTTDSEEYIDEGQGHDEAVIGADDTGMLQEQRITVETEIAEGLTGEET